MEILDRFLSYVKIDTQSDPSSGKTPSTEGQRVLARQLLQELRELGIRDAELTEGGTLYAHLPENGAPDAPTVGFLAHLDTSPDCSGRDVHPRITAPYDGGPLVLSPEIVLTPEKDPALLRSVGHTLVTSDGTTLLGGDDKAGIAAVMTACAELAAHPERRHGRIALAFTPDEEIGEGTKYFDLARFGADFAFTVDGSDVSEYCDETFNAVSAEAVFRGAAVHTGDAKGKMVNAAVAAAEFIALLPAWMRPEHTEGREGFLHLQQMEGTVEKARLSYLLRDHDAEKLRAQEELFRRCADAVNLRYGPGTAEVSFTETYRNMREVLRERPEIEALAFRAMRACGLEPRRTAVRGGTDGAVLSFRGLPCPNLGNGDANPHGRTEYVDVWQMQKAAELIVRIAAEAAQENGCGEG